MLHKYSTRQMMIIVGASLSAMAQSQNGVSLSCWQLPIAAAWPVSGVHSCAVVQYLSLHYTGQRAESCLAVGAGATVLLSVHQFLPDAGPCLALFSDVVVPLYHLASRNAQRNSC